MIMIILCSKRSFFVYYRSKFLKYNTIPVKVIFKLVSQSKIGKWKKNKFDSFFLLVPYFFKKWSFSLLHFPYLSL